MYTELQNDVNAQLRALELDKYTINELARALRMRGVVVDTESYMKRHTEAHNKSEGLL